MESLSLSLESQNFKTVIEALQKTLSLSAKGLNMSVVFPSVIKAIACQSVAIKKLSYIYIDIYGYSNQDLCLLLVNTLQKDLEDSNQMIRGLALRTLCSIPLKILTPIQLLSITRCVKDKSVHVRQMAAHVMRKVIKIDKESLKSTLTELLLILLSDNSSLVLSAAIKAFYAISPDRLDLLHSFYRRLVSLLPDADHATQVAILKLMTSYVRLNFPNPNTVASDDVNKDYNLLINASLPLLHSQNSAVIISCSLFLYHSGPRELFSDLCIQPLLLFVKGRPEVSFCVLSAIRDLLKQEFYVLPRDAPSSVQIKLEILSLLINNENIIDILDEFEEYINGSCLLLASKTVKALGDLTYAQKEIEESVLNSLYRLVNLTNHDQLVSNAVMSICKITDSSNKDQISIFYSLFGVFKRLEAQTKKLLLSTMLQLHGFDQDVQKIALAQSLVNFHNENIEIKVLSISLAIKEFVTFPNDSDYADLLLFVMNLCRFDASVFIRDRVRLVKKFMFGLDTSFDFTSLPQLSLDKLHDLNQIFFPQRQKYSSPIFERLDEELPEWNEKVLNAELRDSSAHEHSEGYQTPPATSPLLQQKQVFVQPMDESDAREMYDELEEFLNDVL